MDTIGERLKSERKRLGLSQEAFAVLGGASKPSQVRYENGERSPDGVYLSSIASQGADVLYILTGVRSQRPSMGIFGPLTHEFGPLEHPALTGSPAPAPAPSTPGLHEGGTNDTLSIPWLEPRLGQGSAPIRLSFSWLQAVGLAIDRLRAVIADEVQLPGCLAGATLALVEVPSRPTEEPGCWAFYEEGRLLIARVQAQGAATILLPVDAGGRARLYQPTDLSFRQLGKVVWLAIVRP